MRWAEHVARKRQINTFVSETLKSQIGNTASSSLSSPAVRTTPVGTVLHANGCGIQAAPPWARIDRTDLPGWLSHLCHMLDRLTESNTRICAYKICPFPAGTKFGCPTAVQLRLINTDSLHAAESFFGS